MARYHMRRADREIKDPDELLKIVERGVYVTVAMCRDSRPYLVTVNYSFDRSKRCMYFHAAHEGLKMDYLRSNPRVWCQILEDLGYVREDCDWGYRTVHIDASVRVVENEEEKRRALDMMIDKLDENPDEARKMHLENADIDKVCICRIDIEEMFGKESKRKER